MRCRKIAFRPCFLSRNDGGYSINPFCPGIFAIDDACLPVSVRLAYSPHAVLSRSILGLSFVILSQHLSRNNKPWCPEMCPRSGSINIWRAPKVNDDTLSARHCVTECIYSISRAPRFGDPVHGTAACRYERQAAQSRRLSSAQGPTKKAQLYS